MQSSLTLSRVLLTMAVLSVAGCFPYNPYGYGGNNGPFMMPQPNSVPPGGAPGAGAYLNPGSFPGSFPGNGQGTELQSPVAGGQVQQWQQSKQTDPTLQAPRYESKQGGFEQPADPNAVPEYKDPASLDNAPGQSNSTDSIDSDLDSPFQKQEGSRIESERYGAFVASDNDRGSEAAVVEQTGGDEGSQFVTPIPVSSNNTSQDAGGRDFADSSSKPNPFAYDRQGYGWLRGIVEFDEPSKTWYLLYDDNPDPADRFGGDIALVDDARLNKLQTGDVVLVEGLVDPQIRDARGNMSYRVSKLQPLAFKK